MNRETLLTSSERIGKRILAVAVFEATSVIVAVKMQTLKSF